MRNAMLVSFVFLAAAFAGCTSGGSDAKEKGDPALQGNVRSTLASADLATGRGAVEGTVLNENGAPLASAYVALLKTAFHASTDKTGRFQFADLAPGVYTLRADLAQYESVESKLSVVVDKVTQVDVVLISSNGAGVGFRDHVHNLWDDAEKERTLFDQDVQQMNPNTQMVGDYHVSGCAAAAVTDSGSKAGGCWLIDFHLKSGTTVPPGTKEMRMSVTWPKQDAVQSIEWRYAPANESAFRVVKDVRSGQVLVVPVASPMNDHGHAAFTMWKFQMYAKPKAGGVVAISEDHFNSQFIGAYRVKIVAVKGDVFSEPPHKRYWAAGPRIMLTENEERKVVGTSLARDPNTQSCNPTGAPSVGTVCYNFIHNKTIPPGATRLLVAMDYTWAQPAAAALFHHKTLTFRTANVNPAVATWDDFIAPKPKETTPGHLTWEIKLDPMWTDAFYQSRSTWLLLIGNQGDERADTYTPDCPSSCGGDLFKLTAEVVNDDWTEALAGGQS